MTSNRLFSLTAAGQTAAALLLCAAALNACNPKPVDDGPVEAFALPAPPVAPDICPERLPAPEQLPGITAAHLTLDYWLPRIAESGDLDEVLLDAADVAALNDSYAHPDNPPLRRVALDTPDAAALLQEVNERLEWMRSKVDAGDYVTADGAMPDAAVRTSLAARTSLQLAPSLHTVTTPVQVLCAPFTAPLYTPSLDLRFNRNNCSMLRAGEAVQVLERGADVWLVRSGYTLGWIPAGTALGAAGPAAPPATAPLTRRALFTQAFALLGTPYGWGGEGAGRDCSRFIMDVFAQFGLDLPRFSAFQSLAGSFSIDVSEVASEAERALLIDAAAERGVVLLHFPGHIMLYLGRDEDDRPMAIHAFAEYLEPCDTPEADGDIETLFEVDQVTVSDLELGRGSSRTAFIERVTRITVIGGTPGVGLQGVAERRMPAPLDAGEGVGCPGDDDVFLIVNPQRPNAEQPLRVIATATNDFGSVEIAFTDPNGVRHVPPMQRLGGPPYAVVAQIDSPMVGEWTIAMGEHGRVLECESANVRSRRPSEGTGTGAVWDVRHNWSAGYENLYATWVESLFGYDLEEDLTWTSLHELTEHPDHNLLYDYYGEREDEQLEMGPDCADLPYMMRAYFSWKMGLPFGYRQCSRGRAGQPPRCDNLQTNLQPRVNPGNVDAFQHFAQRSVRSGVHSASGRTAPDDDSTDYYPVSLDREHLLPGTLYADPYGHLLIIGGWRAQGTDGYGILVGADAQPDGTVGRRRFWRGSFLFSPDTTDVGAGFKRYRPLRYSRSAGEMVSLTNDQLDEDSGFAPYSREQYEGTTDDFYMQMEGIINPRPLDPLAMQVSLVDALEESVSRRLNSVDNGERYMSSRRFAEMEMPTGYSIFETSGGWEDFATPSRDMRLLISIDTVRLFPSRARQSPERFGLPAEGPALDAAMVEIEQALAAELERRTFQYTRTDGELWTLTLADVVARMEAMEMAYNPNDCPEIRWGAPEGTEEYATCDRHAPRFQRERMAEYRSWFRDRTRPAR